MIENCLPTRGHSSSLSIGKQKAVLFCQNEARGDCIHPNLSAIFLCHVNRQPLGEICYCGLRRAICRNTGQRTQRIPRCHIDNTALSSLGHTPSKHLTTLKRSDEI